MFELIARLRTRPVAYRRKTAFWTAIGITALIVLMWGVSLSIRFGEVVAVPTEEPSDVPGPFETFFNQTKNGFSSIKKSFTKESF